MAAVPAGEFDMGSPADEQGRWEDEAQHHVRVARPFWIATTEVTQAIWSAVTGANPSSKEGPTLPVTDVSWEDCQDFLRRLNARVEGGGFRLPTEAEWEYACRAGATSRYAFGDDERELVGFAWYRANSGLSPQPVGTRRPNAWGLHDMHGNVWEWCEDAYAMHAEAEDAGMDAAWVAASERVMRGGGWSYPARVMRSAQRMHGRPDFRCSRLGLRLARDMEGH
jgi:formylglycine-generating enzyme required for sulfatase activity